MVMLYVDMHSDPWARKAKSTICCLIYSVSQSRGGGGGEIVHWDPSAVSRGSTPIYFSFSLCQMMIVFGLVIYIYVTLSALLQILYLLNIL